MSSLKRSLGIAFLTQYAELVIQFIGVMILARIITSEEIGIYSVAAFLMALLHVFRDFGVCKYVIQEQNLTPEKIRSAFGVAIILAWCVALVLFLCSGLLADFYNEPQVRDILILMSASFAVTPVGSLLNAIFRRDMQLKKIAVIRISSTVCHVVVAVTMALLGYGAMSLAWANFASIVSFGIVAMLLRPPATPLVPSFRNTREILSFGSIASLGSVASVAGTNAPDVIIGKAISLAATGYYSRGNGLVQMFRTLVSGAILPLVLPYFAQLRREQADIVAPYHRAVENLTGFAWPFFAVMALLALPIVRTLYGDNWDASVPIVQILCLASAVAMLSTFAEEVMIAYGHLKVVTKLQLMIQPVRVVAILVGSTQGLFAIGIALVVSECIAVAVTSRLLYNTTGVMLSGVLRATAKSLLVTGLCIVGPAIVVLVSPPGQYHFLTLVIGAAGAFGGWLLGIVWSDHPMKEHLYHAKLWLYANAPWGR